MLFKKKNKLTSVGITVGKNNGGQQDGYTRLRDNVLYMNADGKTKVFQLESSVASEGKTTVASNLAVSLGLINKKVVVVDLDFYRPRVHRMFYVEKERGIADYILGNLKSTSIIKKTKYENVDVITGGSEVYNASLIFLSDKFKKLIDELKKKYDYVILDCPPILQISDYIHISKVADGVLFIVAYASTTKKQVAEGIKELKKNGANILGTVFTMYDRKKDKDFYESAYKSYYDDVEEVEEVEDIEYIEDVEEGEEQIEIIQKQEPSTQPAKKDKKVVIKNEDNVVIDGQIKEILENIIQEDDEGEYIIESVVEEKGE